MCRVGGNAIANTYRHSNGTFGILLNTVYPQITQSATSGRPPSVVILTVVIGHIVRFVCVPSLHPQSPLTYAIQQTCCFAGAKPFNLTRVCFRCYRRFIEISEVPLITMI